MECMVALKGACSWSCIGSAWHGEFSTVSTRSGPHNTSRIRQICNSTPRQVRHSPLAIARPTSSAIRIHGRDAFLWVKSSATLVHVLLRGRRTHKRSLRMDASQTASKEMLTNVNSYGPCSGPRRTCLNTPMDERLPFRANPRLQ